MKESTRSDRRVIIIVANIKKFRPPFYDALSRALIEKGISLRVIYSEPSVEEAEKQDSVELPRDYALKVARWYAIGGRILVQWIRPTLLTSADLVIVVNAAGYLLNYPLLLASRLRLLRVALWGHGFNQQGQSAELGEKIKRRTVRWAAHWFAYTNSTGNYLQSCGVGRSRITVIQNAIDTNSIRREVESVSVADVNKFLIQICAGMGSEIALFCGSLYAEKRIDVLVAAAIEIAKVRPKFILLIIGDGPLRGLVEAACNGSSCIRYLGPVHGRHKAIALRSASVVLNPGLVGLGVLDCFAAGVPLVTMSDALHSPEIEYLEDGFNGVVSAPHLKGFIDSP